MNHQCGATISLARGDRQGTACGTTPMDRNSTQGRARKSWWSAVTEYLGLTPFWPARQRSSIKHAGYPGRRPRAKQCRPRNSWFAVVFPALVLNYLGQGAYPASGAPAANCFTISCRNRCSLPLVLLATVATVTASQALISGAFSLAA